MSIAQAALPRHKHPESPKAPLRLIAGHGGGPPTTWSKPPIASGQLAIIIVIAFETMLFAGLVAAYLVLRTSNIAWPPPNLPRLPIALTWINTAVLLASAVTMFASVAAIRAGRRSAFLRYLVVTTALGSLFLAVQGSEWTNLIAQGLTLQVHVYGAIFYSLIGLHALHVVAAVVWLLVLTVLAWRGAFDVKSYSAVSVCATYWYFVSALWVVLFGIVYLY